LPARKHVLSLSKGDLKELEEIFRSKVLAMLKGEGKINDGLIEKLLAWHHSGFSVHAGNRIARDDRDGQKALAEYILRNAFSEQKITYIEDSGKVLYRSAMTHGSNKKNPVLSLSKGSRSSRPRNSSPPSLSIFPTSIFRW
jgi:hypothetical protein